MPVLKVAAMEIRQHVYRHIDQTQVHYTVQNNNFVQDLSFGLVRTSCMVVFVNSVYYLYASRRSRTRDAVKLIVCLFQL